VGGVIDSRRRAGVAARWFPCAARRV